MCDELNLIQTHLGIWDVREWDWSIIVRQFNGLKGLYLIRCKVNNKMLIGEGALGNGDQDSRIATHMRGSGSNAAFKTDLDTYGKEQFELYGFIIEEDAQTRRNIEYALHSYFKDMCYNMARPPIWMVVKLHKEGKTKKEIAVILNCNITHVYKHIKSELTSKYMGVYYDKTKNSYVVKYQARPITTNLGSYSSEIEAAQNRDYYIVKNDLMHKEGLNFYDINYTNFVPHKTRNGEVNKHLQ